MRRGEIAANLAMLQLRQQVKSHDAPGKFRHPSVAELATAKSLPTLIHDVAVKILRKVRAVTSVTEMNRCQKY
jgi:hypothetical protein